MVSNSRPFFFRLLCLFLACLILANALIIPVRASVLLEVLAVTTRNMIASLIRACGVYVADGIEDSLQDGLSAWEMLVDYVSSRVPAEYLYINAAGEKFVKMIFQDGLYYVDRNLVESVLYILTHHGLDSSGHEVLPIGYGFPDMEQWQVNKISSILSDCESLHSRYYSGYTRELPYCTFIEFSSSYSTLYGSPLVVFSEEPCDSWFNPNSGVLHVEVPAGLGIMLWTDSSGGNGTYRSTTSTSYTFNMNVDGATISDFEGDITVQPHGGFGGTFDSIAVESSTPTISNSWSAAATTVTDDRVGGTVTALPVTVPSSSSAAATAPKDEVTSGTKVESESVPVPDTNTGTDVGTQTKPDIGTDAETQTGFWSSVLSWFGSIWDVLSQILSGVLAIPIAIVQAIASAVAEVIEAIKALDPDAPKFDDFQVPSLQSFFPFCIPFDLLDMMRALNASPEAPSFTFACPLPGGGVYNVHIDLSAWNGVASTIRSVTIAIYVVALANSTRKFIKW